MTLKTWSAGEKVNASDLNGNFSSLNSDVGRGIFGDGSHGSVHITAGASYSFGSLAGSIFTMSGDMFATDLLIDNGYTLKPSGYKIFCTGTLTNNGTISANGGDASVSTGGVAAHAIGTLPAPSAGPDGASGGGAYTDGSGGGGQGAIVNGTSVTNSLVSGTPVAGGTGGGGGGDATHANGAAQSPGSIGTITSINAKINFHRINSLLWNAIVQSLTDGITLAWATLSAKNGGAGGGGWGGATLPGNWRWGGGGGGGGGNGGWIYILAKIIINNGTISAIGGNGANGISGQAGSGTWGGGGGGGGGAGGNGGVILLGYFDLDDNGTLTVAGGTKGTKGLAGGSGGGTGKPGSDGTDGTNGIAGTIYSISFL